jgi:hypothetical protein
VFQTICIGGTSNKQLGFGTPGGQGGRTVSDLSTEGFISSTHSGGFGQGGVIVDGGGSHITGDASGCTC